MLRELYQEVIIDHGRHPRNFGALAEANCRKEGFNPLCGDKLLFHVFFNNGVIEKIRFEGTGCAISMASASLLTERLQGKTLQEFDEIFLMFHQWMTEGSISDDLKKRLGKLAVLGGVAEFPVRVKCATLAWHTLKAALTQDIKRVSTEE
jgi:nitrogen fixation protein NifU and related proteins